MMERQFLLLFVLSALAPVRTNADSEDAHQWPFGTTDTKDLMSRQKQLDLYNLGLLGAKGWDANLPDPERKMDMSGGRRRFSVNEPDGPDVGPDRLKIFAIMEKGPADRAGLRLGDIIVGINNETFIEGCYEPLAEALIEAESGARRGELTLRVEREGDELELKVKIPSGGRESLNPLDQKAQDKVLASALKWLATRQQGDGGYPETTGGRNGAIVQTCIAGLAWIGGGSSLAGGRYKKNLKSAFNFVTSNLGAPDRMAGLLGGDANWDQTTWAYAYAAIFLGELHAAKASRQVKKELQPIVNELAKRQEQSGGYGHGPGGKNALGYIELNILGSLVLSGMGLAKNAGCAIDEDVADRLLAYLKASASEDGGVGYSASPGQAGIGNIGRTAAGWLGAELLGRTDEPWCQKMRGYVESNHTEIFEGHASLMQHIMLSGIAANALGPQATEAWWQARKVDYTLARAPDGSIQPRVWHESLAMSSNSDVSVGEVWTTASWATILGAAPSRKKGGLKGWCGAILNRQGK